MDLTSEEKEGLRDLLAKLREIAEDFSHAYLSRLQLLVPERRLRAFTSVLDGGELLLLSLAEIVALLDEPEQLAAKPVLGENHLPKDSPAENYDLKVECCFWAAEHCLGDAFTPQARSGLRKVSTFRRAAFLSQRAGGAAASATAGRA